MLESKRSDGRPPLAGFLPVARRWRWMLLAAALAAGVAGYVTAAGAGQAYESRADVLVGGIGTAEIDVLRAYGQQAETYAEIAKSGPLLDATGQRLGLRNVGSNLTVTSNAVTRVLTIAVQNSDADLAARIANTHAGNAHRLREPQPGRPRAARLAAAHRQGRAVVVGRRARPADRGRAGRAGRPAGRPRARAAARPLGRRRARGGRPRAGRRGARAWPRCRAGRCARRASSRARAAGPPEARPPVPTGCSRPRSRSSPGPASSS